MSSGSRLPREEFVNEPEIDPPIGSVLRAATSLTNMDTRQQKIVLFSIISISIGSCILGFLSMFAISQSSLSMMSRLNRDSSTDQAFITEEIFARISRKDLGENLEFFAEKPHPAGEDQDKDLANWIRKLFEDILRMDQVTTHTYKVLLSYPQDDNKVEVMNGNTAVFEAQLTEDSVKNNGDSNIIQAFNAYSAEGDIDDPAPLYVNYASLEDFKTLAKKNIDVKKILIARYGKVPVAEKVRLAEKYEAKGLILFGDPEEVAQDGTSSSEVYPSKDQWWLPGSGVIRESAFLSNGDPQTPNWPSLQEVHKVSGENLTDSLPKIPVQSIGYEDAKMIMEYLGGNDLSSNDYQGWTGGLGIDYKLGGSPMKDSLRLHLQTTNELVKKDIQNVVGIIRGHVEPDRYVIIGNHRDSMVYGAIDPSSGTSVMVHIATAIIETMRSYGWRPRRTLVFVSFSGSEFGHIGAQEWLEEHLPKLKNRVVSYINIDGCVSGHAIDATASVPLKKVIVEALKNVPDPINYNDYERTYYDFWKDQKVLTYICILWILFNVIILQTNEPYVNHLGYNGDYIPFAYQAGIPSMDIRFTNIDQNISRTYPTHGTGYDSLKYYKTIDPDFRFLETCSQFLVYLIRQLSDSLLLPFDVMEYSNVLREALDGIEKYSETRVEQLPASSNTNAEFKDYLRDNDVSLDLLDRAIDGFKEVSKVWNQTLETVDKTNPILIRMLNDQMMQLEKAFLSPAGLPLQKTTNHVIFSTKNLGSNDYGKATFPGIVNLLEEFNQLQTEDERKKWTGWEDLRRHVTEIYVCILQASSLLKPHHDI